MLDLREIKRKKENEEKNALLLKKKRKAKGVFLRFSIYLVIFLLIGSILYLNNLFVIFGGDSKNATFWDKVPVIGQIKQLAESSDKKIKGEKNDRINILLMGMGGENHDGGYLADTIMLASYKPSTDEVALLSIPRDMTVPVEGKGRIKVNSVNAYAEFEKEGSGGEAMSQTLENVLGVPIHYYGRADFQGFIDVVNKLDGIRVYVEHTLDDYKYPVMGREDAENYSSRYEHLHIEKGWQKMDGELALKYARSRHAQGAQGSDFARAKRQQKILQAVKRKFESSNMTVKPSLITEVLNEMKEHVGTNIQIWEMIKLWKMGKDVKPSNIHNEVLDDGPNGLLQSSVSTSTGYILTPRDGDFGEIQYLVKNIFKDSEESGKKENNEEPDETFDATIEIRNGTWINGLAGRTSIDLKKHGFEITKIGNSDKKNFQESVIYDLTFGENIKPLKYLKEELGANVSFTIPEWLKQNVREDMRKDDPEMKKPDFLIILGKSASKTAED